MLAQVERLGDRKTQLLDLSTARSRCVRLDRQPFDLKVLLDRRCASRRERARVTMTGASDPSDIELEADQERLKPGGLQLARTRWRHTDDG